MPIGMTMPMTMTTGEPQTAPTDGVPGSLPPPLADNLTRHVMTAFQKAKRDRENNGIDEELLTALYQVRGEYDPEQLAKLAKQEHPVIYVPLTDTKVRGMRSRIMEICWRDNVMEMRPSKVPELSEEHYTEIATNVLSVVKQMGMLTLRQQLPPEALAQVPPEVLDGLSMEIGLSLVPPEKQWTFAMAMRDNMEREVNERSEESCAKMNAVIKTQFQVGKWKDAFAESINDMIVYGSGFLHGPVPLVESRLKWEKKKGRYVPVYDWETTQTWESISPWDVYPEAGVTDIAEGDLCVRVRFAPEKLRKMAAMEVPGYFVDGIAKALSGDSTEEKDAKEMPENYTLDSPQETERKRLTAQTRLDVSKAFVEGIEFWGNAPGHTLSELGFDETPDGKEIEPNEWFAVNAIVANRQVIYCRILNYGELRPYSKSTCYSVPGSFWGLGVPAKMRHTQSMVNSSVRHLFINMAMSSGPQVAVENVNAIDTRHCDLKMKPWKIWYFKNSASSGNRPMYFFQPSDNTPQLLALYDRFLKQADDDTGVPSIAYGNSFLAGRAAATATGLQIAMEGVEKSLREIARNIDSGFLVPSMHRMYVYNMIYSEDESLKCDAHPEARGVLAIALNQQMASRYLDLLNLIKGDPMLIQIVGAEAVYKALYKFVEDGLDIDPGEILKTRSQQEWDRINEGIMQQLLATGAERAGMTAQRSITAGQAENAGAQMDGAEPPQWQEPPRLQSQPQARHPYPDQSMMATQQTGGGGRFAA